MFGTMVEVEGGSERRWGSVLGSFDGYARRVHVGRPRRFFNRRLAGFGDENPAWVFDEEGNVTVGGTPSTGTDYLTAVLDTLKAVAPSVLGIVNTALNRGLQASGGNCPPGYAYYSPIVSRCFRTPGEMSAAETAVQQAGNQYGVSNSNNMLLMGAVGLGLVGLFLALKK